MADSRFVSRTRRLIFFTNFLFNSWTIQSFLHLIEKKFTSFLHNLVPVALFTVQRIYIFNRLQWGFLSFNGNGIHVKVEVVVAITSNLAQIVYLIHANLLALKIWSIDGLLFQIHRFIKAYVKCRWVCIIKISWLILFNWLLFFRHFWFIIYVWCSLLNLN